MSSRVSVNAGEAGGWALRMGDSRRANLLDLHWSRQYPPTPLNLPMQSDYDDSRWNAVCEYCRQDAQRAELPFCQFRRSRAFLCRFNLEPQLVGSDHWGSMYPSLPFIQAFGSDGTFPFAIGTFLLFHPEQVGVHVVWGFNFNLIAVWLSRGLY